MEGTERRKEEGRKRGRKEAKEEGRKEARKKIKKKGWKERKLFQRLLPNFTSFLKNILMIFYYITKL